MVSFNEWLLCTDRIGTGHEQYAYVKKTDKKEPKLTSRFLERRWRDLNPRAGCPTYRISSADPSATWVHLQITFFFMITYQIISVKSFFVNCHFGIFFPKNIEIPFKILYNISCTWRFADKDAAEEHKMVWVSYFLTDIIGNYILLKEDVR